MKYDLLPMIVERHKRTQYIACMDECIAKNNLKPSVNFIKREQLLLIERIREETICED
ncbi:hypothetical protein I4U23_010506 [Adineta vaga]|nr:hypothetical protein I4U23_010506 [Adineta vaga]